MMMDDRVHPMVMSSTGHADDTESVRSTNDDNESLRSSSSSVSGMDSCLLKKKPTAHPGSSYVIQIPKDQIYRVPPPENAHLFDTYTRRANRGGGGSGGVRRRRCLVWALGAAVLVLLALAVAAGALYLVSRPRMPIYTLDSLGIRGFNLSNPILSPEFDVAIRADNPNTKIGIDYRGGGGGSAAASVAYSGVALARGAWPAFYQGPRNATVFGMALKGSGVRLSSGSVQALHEQQARGEVPLEVDAGVPARVKLGPVESWTFEVKVRCDVVVDRLGLGAKIVSSTCKANAAPRW